MPFCRLPRRDPGGSRSFLNSELLHQSSLETCLSFKMAFSGESQAKVTILRCEPLKKALGPDRFPSLATPDKYNLLIASVSPICKTGIMVLIFQGCYWQPTQAHRMVPAIQSGLNKCCWSTCFLRASADSKSTLSGQQQYIHTIAEWVLAGKCGWGPVKPGVGETTAWSPHCPRS